MSVAANLRTTIVDVFANVFNVPAAVVAKGVSPTTIDGWDSAKHVELVIALEERFGCMFEPDDVPSLTTLDQMEQIIARYVEGRTS